MKTLILCLLVSAPAFSSALIGVDKATKTIYVMARLVYSGPAVTKNIAEETTAEIRDMWSETPTKVMIENVTYKVVFEIDHIMASAVPLVNKTSCAYNFITILDPLNEGDTSYYNGRGSRFGAFYTGDNLGHSTIAAHEFGHGLKLRHNLFGKRKAPVPGIMFARNVDPSKRKVRAEDIQAIPLDIAMVELNGVLGCLGDGKPEWIY